MNWPYAYTPYIWPMLASAVFMAGLAVYAWKHRTVLGAGSFAFQMLYCALWALFTTLEIAGISEPPKILSYRLGRMMACPAMTALLVFALEYARSDQQTIRRTVLVLSGVALLISALQATNDLHHLYWTRLWLDGYVRVERGLLGFILGYVFLLPTLALVIFMQLAWRARGIYRSRALLLFAGNVLPLLALSLETLGINPVAPLSPTILTLNLTGLLFMLAIYRFGMLGVVPVGRDVAMERMADGLLILDAEDRIADLNLAAAKALGLARATTIGRRARQVLAAYPELTRLIQEEGAAEVRMNAAAQVRYFQAHASPLIDSSDVKLGRLISIRDVTEQRRAQKQILEQQRALGTLEERERLAHELHDTLVQSTAAIRMQAETADLLLTEGETENVHQNLARIAQAADEMHLDLREYLFGVYAATADQNFVADLRTYLSEYSQRWAIETQLRVQAELERQGLGEEIQAQLWRITQEALANVRKHASARHIDIALERNDACLQLVIRDDGCGFDPSQLAAPHARGFGTRAMRERAESIGGRLEIQSAPGKGTRVVVRIPREEGNARSPR